MLSKIQFEDMESLFTFRERLDDLINNMNDFEEDSKQELTSMIENYMTRYFNLG